MGNHAGFVVFEKKNIHGPDTFSGAKIKNVLWILDDGRPKERVIPLRVENEGEQVPVT